MFRSVAEVIFRGLECFVKEGKEAEVKELEVLDEVKRIIEVGEYTAIAYSEEKNEIYKLSFAGKETKLIWTIKTNKLWFNPMELYIGEEGELKGVFIYLEEGKVILIDPNDGKTKREFNYTLKGYPVCRNMVYLRNKRQLVTIDKQSIQFNSL